MNRVLFRTAHLCLLGALVAATGCSSPPPPAPDPNEKAEQKTEIGGVEKGETLEAPPPPPGALKKK
jgi:hypothetical protein